MNTYIPSEPHVAQQSRRDKLRVQHAPPLYDAPPPPMFSSGAGILDFTSTPTANDDSAFINASTSGIHDPAAWITNNPMQSPLFPSHLYQMKQGISGYHHDHLPPDHNHDKQYGFPSTHQIYPSLHDVVTTPSSHAAVMDNPNPPCSWNGVDGGNELLLLPSYGNPTSASVWMNRGQQNQWYGDGDMERMKVEGGFGAVGTGGGGSSQSQSLSLSLSSNPLPELQAAQFEERLRQEDLAGLPSSIQYPKVSFASVHGPVSTAPDPRKGVGPLGPFTGYAAILKSSKFLKPAQQLLDEFCSLATGSKLARQCDGSGRSSGSASFRQDAAVSISSGGGGDVRGGNSVVSSSSFYGSTEGGGGGGGEAGSSSGSCQMHPPEFQQKRAKLLYMQEEVCRRYKQYHQQMQMVVSSFQSVAGLSAATPYTSLALKSVAKHFRCLKNIISDQLRHVSKLLGEEFMSSSPGSSKGEATTPRLKYIDPSIRKLKAAEHSLSFLDHSQPVWRPQRGLPERAVSVLRAWLFDHFLHPYPTDTDKHMLATQTGLSRNQVSNWFINARVRLWKPMVEEIYMLETKGMSGMDLNSSNRNDGKAVQDDIGQPSADQVSEAHSNGPMDCLPMEPMLDEESSRAMEQWHREKRSRLEECGIPGGMDGSLMSFAAYQGGVDIGGLGAVSLTLGLRHNEGAQQQQKHLRRHFESHMVHDFVG